MVGEDDELEYMPPSAVGKLVTTPRVYEYIEELSHKPPFDMPDYAALGASLFALVAVR